VVLFRTESADDLLDKGAFNVTDQGNSITLEASADRSLKKPDLDVGGSAWTPGVVARPGHQGGGTRTDVRPAGLIVRRASRSKGKAPRLNLNCTPKVGHRSNLWGVFHGEV